MDVTRPVMLLISGIVRLLGAVRAPPPATAPAVRIAVRKRCAVIAWTRTCPRGASRADALRDQLVAAEAAAEQARADAEAARDREDAADRADTARRSSGLLARLRAAWRGE